MLQVFVPFVPCHKVIKTQESAGIRELFSITRTFDYANKNFSFLPFHHLRWFIYSFLTSWVLSQRKISFYMPTHVYFSFTRLIYRDTTLYFIRIFSSLSSKFDIRTTCSQAYPCFAYGHYWTVGVTSYSTKIFNCLTDKRNESFFWFYYIETLTPTHFLLLERVFARRYWYINF
jgi:hypothetical protein